MNLIAPHLSAGVPPRESKSVVAWAEQHVKLPGSAKRKQFDCSLTPWIREPIECVGDGQTRIVTLVKPVQTGGSVAGEVILDYVLATQSGGDVQYNWEDDDKGKDRWNKRIDRILRACKPVMRRAPTERHKWQQCLVMFPHCNLTVQGVFTADNLDSDSIRFQINEEIHNWKPGMLDKARNRTRAFWNSFSMDISNAGTKGDQLHAALKASTHEILENLCPGCGKYHALQIKWDDKHPEYGGLRYDSDGCKREDGSYDYNKLEATARYQMPCGYTFGDDRTERRKIASNYRYTVTNPGARRQHRGFTYEAIVCHDIPFVRLIEKKHRALEALRGGDPEPFKRYVQEDECRFWDEEDVPLGGRLVIMANTKKDREGLLKHPLFHGRFFALDRQQGETAKRELPHWWLVIRDVLRNGDSQLVFEGKVETDGNVIEILDRHECVRRMGVADSGDDTKHVYAFCMRNGINAIKGGNEDWYTHHEVIGGAQRAFKRIYSPEEPLHLYAECPPLYDGPHINEPMFWRYSKKGIRDRLHYLRHPDPRVKDPIKHEVPGDVSEDYQKHNDAEKLEVQRTGRTQSPTMVWRQVRERNDLFVCECYIAMMMEMAGLIGDTTTKG
jgi:hypothetical protein